MFDAHILNLYEAYSLTSQDIQRILDGLNDGSISAVEKIDGQNFTFKIDGRSIKLLGKGIAKWMDTEGGLNRARALEHFKKFPNVVESFQYAFDVIELALSNVLDADFKAINGSCINAEIVFRKNKNVVSYKDDCICMLQSSNSLGLSTDDIARILSSKDIHVTRNLLQSQEHFVQASLDDFFFNDSMTVGAVCERLIEHSLNEMSIFNAIDTKKLAKRLLYNDASALSYSSVRKNERLWQAIKKIEDNRTSFINSSLYDFRKFVYDIGYKVLNKYQFQFADPSFNENILSQIKNIKLASASSMIECSDVQRMKIDDALSMISDVNVKNVEGIVFDYKGQMLKLTGYFTPVNKLFACFRYGINPARIKNGW